MIMTAISKCPVFGLGLTICRSAFKLAPPLLAELNLQATSGNDPSDAAAVSYYSGEFLIQPLLRDGLAQHGNSCESC